jgi:hypothetical protein
MGQDICHGFLGGKAAMVKIVLHKRQVYSFDRDQISLGFTVICTSVEFVLSIVIKWFKF